MPFKRHVIKALIKFDRRRAKKEIKEAYVLARCSITDAASIVGCRRRTFLLWARELGLEDWLRATGRIAKRDGWHHEKVGGGGCHKARRASSE